MTAYSRNPNMLLYNSAGDILTVKNRYKNVYLKIDLSSDLPADTLLYEVVVDWYNTHIKVFIDFDDSLNNVPIFDGNFYIPCEPREASVYVRETFQFLSRGHSIHHPSCICQFNTFSEGRIEELGLQTLCLGASSSSLFCSLNAHKYSRNMSDIGKELGISADLMILVKVSSQSNKSIMPLLQVLINMAGFSLAGDHISSSLCCVPTKISCAQDILDAAKTMYPRPFFLDCRSNDCETKSLLEDLHMLQLRFLVRAVTSTHPNTFAVFYVNKDIEDKVMTYVDSDIRDAWKKDAESSYKFFSGPTQETVEKMLLDQNIQPMQVYCCGGGSGGTLSNSKISKKRKERCENDKNKKVNKLIRHLKSFNKNLTT